MSEHKNHYQELFVQTSRSALEKKHLIITSVLYANGKAQIPLKPDNHMMVPIVEDDTLPIGGEGLYIATNGAWYSRRGLFPGQDDGLILPRSILECYAVITNPICQAYDREAWGEVLRRCEGNTTQHYEYEILERRDLLIEDYARKHRLELAQRLDADLGRVLTVLRCK